MENTSTPPPPASSPSSEGRESTSTEPGRTSKAPRLRFAAIDDVVMLRLVNAKQPWASSKVMAAWESISEELTKTEEFGVVGKKGAAVKSRFDMLRKKFAQNEMESLKKSGVSEEFEERELLLTDIVSRMMAFEEASAKEKAYAKARADGIEVSGVTVREMAMQSMGPILSDDDDAASNDGDDNELDDDDTSSVSTVSTVSTTASTPQSGKKRQSLGQPSGRRYKLSRRDRLDAVMETVLGGLQAGDANKLAKIKAVHETTIEVERMRLEHAERQEQRRIVAEQQRDAKQHEFMLHMIELLRK